MSDLSQDTYKVRLRRYKRREQMTIWVGAALAALLAICTVNILSVLAKRLILSLVVIGGGALGKARIEFEWSATEIERGLEDGTIKAEDSFPNSDKWPALPETMWFTSRWCVILGGFIVLISLWF